MAFSPGGPRDEVSDRSRYGPDGVSPMERREVQIILPKGYKLKKGFDKGMCS